MDLSLAKSPIKVSSVCPALIATPMMDKQLEFGNHSRVVFSGGRALTVEEVGEVILGEVWEKQPMEVAMPFADAWGGRVFGLKPEWGLWASRRLEAKGEKKLEALRRAD